MRTVTLTIQGEQIEVATTFGMIERIETRFGIMEFLNDVAKGNYKMSSIAWVLYCALAVNGDKRKYSEVGEYVIDNFSEAVAAATDVVTTATNVGAEKPAKKK